MSTKSLDAHHTSLLQVRRFCAAKRKAQHPFVTPQAGIVYRFAQLNHQNRPVAVFLYHSPLTPYFSFNVDIICPAIGHILSFSLILTYFIGFTPGFSFDFIV